MCVCNARTAVERRRQQLPHRPGGESLPDIYRRGRRGGRIPSLLLHLVSFSLSISSIHFVDRVFFHIAKALSTIRLAVCRRYRRCESGLGSIRNGSSVLVVFEWSARLSSDKNGNQITGLDAQPSERPVSPCEWPLNLSSISAITHTCIHTHVKRCRIRIFFIVKTIYCRFLMINTYLITGIKKSITYLINLMIS